MNRLKKRREKISPKPFASGRRCLICGAAALNKPYYRSDRWLVLRCSECTYAWGVDLDDRPQDTAFDWGAEVVRESQHRMEMYKDRLRRIHKFSPQPRSWLDIGCGGGGLLKCAADAGYITEGIEPSPSADTIRAWLKVPVHKSTLAQAMPELSFKRYGVISYFHVLEHLPDPHDELKTASSLLGEDSLLVIEVPHFDSPMWKLFRSYHRHFYRAHRSYFNCNSLSVLLRRAGYKVVISESVPYKISFGWFLKRCGKLTEQLGRALPKRLKSYTMHFNLGEYLLVIAKREEG